MNRTVKAVEMPNRYETVKSIAARVDHRVEKHTAFLGMLAYMATMPLVAVIGFVLYAGF